MAAHGRPTPQVDGASGGANRIARFKDARYAPGRVVNTYVASHREMAPYGLSASDAFALRERWDTHFGRTAPLVVEIGPGNGSFMVELAARHPENDHVAVEIRYKRVVQCALKLEKDALKNATTVRYHAAYLDDLFVPGSLAGLWVNHPDPWPKSRHEKNRLISRWFLEDAASLLMPGASLKLKSDFLPNVTRAVALLDRDADGEALPRLPFVATEPVDLRSEAAPWPDDIETGYQHKFISVGEPVYAVQLTRTEGAR